METNIQERIFQWIQESTQKITDFALVEVPPFIHEYLNWKFWEAGFDVMLFLVGFVFTIFWVNHFWGKKNKEETVKLIGGRSGPDIIPIVGGVMVSLCLCCGVIIAVFYILIPSVKDMVQIKIAPKIYLIEKCSEIIKSN